MSAHPSPALGRSIPFTLGLLASTALVGLAVRYAPLGLPPFVVKYGASMLWALLIYWIVSALLPARILTAALLAASIATAVELFKLVQMPALDAFRQTLPGALLLGRFFSVEAILSYWLAITLGALADRFLCSRRPADAPPRI